MAAVRIPARTSASGIGTAAAAGAKPEGALDERGAADAVQAMFNSIAPRYDLVNHVLSANIDRLWWWRTARRFRTVLADPDAAILDICCGTGDMTMALLKRRPAGAKPVIAADFAREMLARGARKFTGPFAHHGHAIALEADALHLPLRSESLDLITTAFGFRNLANYRDGLAEFHRVLKPGGQIGILDFSEPDGLLGRLYQVYFRRILPVIGRVIGGKDSAYNYLPASVSKFPPPPEMLEMMRAAGFRDVRWTPYTFGIAGLFTGVRTER
jgi:demethylmenaquinone methyltransferase/2-methoxy-6-polyprenyl-1,4-benzoquinol methylase